MDQAKTQKEEAIEQPRSAQLIQQQQAQVGVVPIQGINLPVTPGTAAIPNPGNTMMLDQAFQQLMQSLRPPQSPQEQQHILQKLKSNPQLMAAFNKKLQDVSNLRTQAMQLKNAVPDSNIHDLTPEPQSVVPENSSIMSSRGMEMSSHLATQTPPVNFLKVVKQAKAVRQKQPLACYDELNRDADVLGQNMPPFQIQQAMSHLEIGQEQWQQRHPAGQGLRQPISAQFVQQQQAQLGARPLQSGNPQVTPANPTITNPGNTMMHNQALQELTETLRSPQSPDQQRQILQKLKSNPQLMAAFIKHRWAQAQAEKDASTEVAEM